MSFPTPVNVTANTTYVASYYAPRGHYSADSGYLYPRPAPATDGYSITDSPPLHVKRSTPGDGNGLYRYGASSGFPTASFQAENYWVDVAFTPSGPPPPPTAPGQVAAVTATAGDARATVSWTPPIDGGSPITSYTVTPYVGTTARTPVTITGNPPAASTTVTGLTNGTAYTFTVAATNAIGTGTASAPSAAVTPAPPTVPGAPTAVAAGAGNAAATVSWAAPSNGGSPITSYTVTPYIGTTAQTPVTVTGNPPATSTTVTGLTNGTDYTFTVRATNGVGAGPASAASAPVTPVPSPVVDTKVSVNATGTTATTPAFSTAQPNEVLLAFVSADGPSTGGQTATVTGAGLTWALVGRSNAQPGTAEVWRAVAPTTLTGATVSSTESLGGHHQMLTVVAVQGSGGTGAVQAGAAPTGAPAVSLTASRSSSLVYGVGFDWDGATARTVGSGQSMDTQWLDPGYGTFWVQRLTAPAGAAGSLVSVNDTAPTNHRWNMLAVEIIPTTSPVAPTVPGAPTGVVATAGNGSAAVSWSAPASNGGSALTSYRVTPFIGAVAQAPVTVSGSPPATSTTVTGLANGTAYTFRVAAANTVGTGADSAASAAVTPTAPPAPTVPGAPTGVVATAGNGSAAVSWSAPASNGGSALTSYRVTPFIGAVAQAPVTVSGSPPATSTTVTGLANGTAYTFRVAAANTVGTGADSAASAAVTPTAPPPSPTVDTKVSVNATGTTATTPAFSTAQPNEVLLAFVSADGPSAGGQTATVTGAGLTWALVGRSNAQAGTAEVWAAVAPTALTGVTVTSTESRTGFHQMLTVVAFRSAGGTGAVLAANAATGAPTASVTTTRAGSLVYGVGFDWDGDLARTVGAGQTMDNQWLDPGYGTFWVQHRTAAAGAAGSAVTINDTAPTNHRWNLLAVEILAVA